MSASPARTTPDPPRGRSLVKKGGAQFAGQALGLLLALLVSHMIARRLGIGPEADAFMLGRRLITAVAEALNQVVVVVFIPLVAAQAAIGVGIWRIVLRSAGPALAAGAVLALAFWAGAPFVVNSIAPEFAPETQGLAIKVMRVMALSLPATVATIALSSYCNIRGRFGTPAAIRQAPRAAVAAAFALAVTGSVAITAAWSYTLAVCAVTALTLAVALRLSRTPVPVAPPVMKDNSATRRRGAAAVILSLGALGVLWIETAFAAAQGPGGVVMLDFGQRLGALLGNTMSMALGLVVFADLSRRAAEGQTAELGRAFHRATWIGLALILPVTVGMIANAGALVELVMGYGAFAEAELHGTVTRLVQLMSVAPLGAFVLRMMIARILSEDRLPMVKLITVAILTDLGARIGLFVLLTPSFGLAGIPLTLIVAPIVPAMVMVLWLRGDGTFAGAEGIREALPMLAVAIFTGMAVVGGSVLAPMLATGWEAKPLAGLQLALSAGLGLIVLAAGLLVFRIKPRLT